jgi:hypothetical protein
LFSALDKTGVDEAAARVLELLGLAPESGTAGSTSIADAQKKTPAQGE